MFAATGKFKSRGIGDQANEGTAISGMHPGWAVLSMLLLVGAVVGVARAPDGGIANGVLSSGSLRLRSKNARSPRFLRVWRGVLARCPTPCS